MALFTLEAKYIALTKAIKEAQWLQGLYTKIQQPIPGAIALYNNNTGAIATAKDPKHYQCIKHTLVKFIYTRKA